MNRRIQFVLIMVLAFVATLPTSRASALSIGGAVRQPLNLTLDDLTNLARNEVQLSEVMKKEGFNGTFTYRGVSLRTLLQMAAVEKEKDGYSKPIDMAVLIHNREGKRAVLSWGEVFYRRSGDIIVATSATPVMPGALKSCNQCHEAEVYQRALDRLGRRIGFPKLVVSGDVYTDRCLEDIAHIEVIDLRKEEERKKEGQRASSATFSVSSGTGGERVFMSLAGYPRASLLMKVVGSGRGYHGTKRVEGAPLRELLGEAESAGAIDSAALITSTDGYRSLVSLGELFLSSLGDRVIITDHAQDGAAKEVKQFDLVIPDDIFADRMVKSVSRIEVIPMRPVARVYIVGVGCGDTSLMTLEAISFLGKAGAFIGGKTFTDRFARYMGGKPILFDPFTSWEPVYRKNHPELSDEEVRRQSTDLRAAEIRSIWDTLRAGKSVAVLEPGDPTIYGGWENWLLPEFAGHIEVVAGLSSFSAANAMMGKNVASNRNSMILTTPWALQTHEETVKSVAAAADTMAIFMGLKELKNLLPLLKKYYPEETVVTIAYKAGITHEKRLVKTSLSGLLTAAEKEGEDFLGLVYIGGK